MHITPPSTPFIEVDSRRLNGEDDPCAYRAPIISHRLMRTGHTCLPFLTGDGRVPWISGKRSLLRSLPYQSFGELHASSGNDERRRLVCGQAIAAGKF